MPDSWAYYSKYNMTFKMELTKKNELEFTFHLKNLQQKYIVRTTIDLQNYFNSDA